MGQLESVYEVIVTMLDNSTYKVEMTEQQLNDFTESLNTKIIILLDWESGDDGRKYNGIFIKSDQVKTIKFEYSYDQ